MPTEFQDVDAWFSSLGRPNLGKLPADHALIRAYGGQGWRLKTMGVIVAVLADDDFPYSKPQAFVEAYDRKRPRPHIEPLKDVPGSARICIDSVALPDDPLLSIKTAVHEARSLLKANDNGEEDEDFENDFRLYWHHYLPAGARNARLLGLSEISEGAGACHLAGDSYFCFPNKVILRRWAVNIASLTVKRPRRFPIVPLSLFPRPDRYPHDAASLLTFLERHSTRGIELIADMLRACPKRIPVVFSGTAPNGRTFQVAVELLLKTDTKGRSPVRAHAHSKLSDKGVFDQYNVFPLDTRDMGAATSRMNNRDQAAMGKKVVVVGCGAIGSAIVMTLAKAGVSRIVLVDPDRLGWENIRRHELGADSVDESKVIALKGRILRSVPETERVDALPIRLQTAIRERSDLLTGIDLVVSATGDWACDAFLDQALEAMETPPPALYAWTEAFGLAAQAILISRAGTRLTSGFEIEGTFKGQSSHTDLPAPDECGNSTSPFGQIEVSQAHVVATKLALESLAGMHVGENVWRTWTTDRRSLEASEGRWTQWWLDHHGTPPDEGGFWSAAWDF